VRSSNLASIGSLFSLSYIRIGKLPPILLSIISLLNIGETNNDNDAKNKRMGITLKNKVT
jgi:hypothetical protein